MPPSNLNVKEWEKKIDAASDLKGQAAVDRIEQLMTEYGNASQAGADVEFLPQVGIAFRKVAGKEYKLAKDATVGNSAMTWKYTVPYLFQPKSLKGTMELVRDAASWGIQIRALGSKHSFSKVVHARGGYVDMGRSYQDDWLDQKVIANLKSSVNAERMVNVPGGMGIEELNERLGSDKDKAKLFKKNGDRRRLYNMGGADLQTFAGAFSNGTHGTGGEISTYHDAVRSLVLVAGDGLAYRIEPSDGITDPETHKNFHAKTKHGPKIVLVQDDDAFYSVLVSFGCMGIVYSCIIETEKQSLFHEESFYYKWDVPGPAPSAQPEAKDQRPRIWSDEMAKTLRTIPLMRDRVAKSLPEEVLPKQSQSCYYNILINPYTIDRPAAFDPKKHQFGHSILERIIVSDKLGTPTKKKKRRKFWPMAFTGLNISADLVRSSTTRGWPRAVPVVETALRNLDDNFLSKGKGYSDISYKVWNTGAGKTRAFGMAVELAFPTDMISDVLAILLPMLEQIARNSGHYLNVPISLRFVTPSKAYLAPNSGKYRRKDKVEEEDIKEWCYLELLRVTAVDPAERRKEIELYHQLQTTLYLQFEGRIHWGLNFDFSFTVERLYRLYPKFDKWLQQFHRFNPKGLFDNELTDQSGIRFEANRLAGLGQVPGLPV